MKRKTIRLLFIMILFLIGMGSQVKAQTVDIAGATLNAFDLTCLPTSYLGVAGQEVTVEVTIPTDLTAVLGSTWSGVLQVQGIIAITNTFSGSGLTAANPSLFPSPWTDISVTNGIVDTDEETFTIVSSVKIAAYNLLNEGSYTATVNYNGYKVGTDEGSINLNPSLSQLGTITITFQPEPFSFTRDVAGDLCTGEDARIVTITPNVTTAPAQEDVTYVLKLVDVNGNINHTGWEAGTTAFTELFEGTPFEYETFDAAAGNFYRLVLSESLSVPLGIATHSGLTDGAETFTVSAVGAYRGDCLLEDNSSIEILPINLVYTVNPVPEITSPIEDVTNTIPANETGVDYGLFYNAFCADEATTYDVTIESKHTNRLTFSDISLISVSSSDYVIVGNDIVPTAAGGFLTSTDITINIPALAVGESIQFTVTASLDGTNCDDPAIINTIAFIITPLEVGGVETAEVTATHHLTTPGTEELETTDFTENGNASALTLCSGDELGFGFLLEDYSAAFGTLTNGFLLDITANELESDAKITFTTPLGPDVNPWTKGATSTLIPLEGFDGGGTFTNDTDYPQSATITVTPFRYKSIANDLAEICLNEDETFTFILTVNPVSTITNTDTESLTTAISEANVAPLLDAFQGLDGFYEEFCIEDTSAPSFTITTEHTNVLTISDIVNESGADLAALISVIANVPVTVTNDGTDITITSDKDAGDFLTETVITVEAALGLEEGEYTAFTVTSSLDGSDCVENNVIAIIVTPLPVSGFEAFSLTTSPIGDEDQEFDESNYDEVEDRDVVICSEQSVSFAVALWDDGKVDGFKLEIGANSLTSTSPILTYDWTETSGGLNVNVPKALADTYLGTPTAVTLVNDGTVPETVTIKLTPYRIIDGVECYKESGAISFTITVNPIPEVVSVPAEQFYCPDDNEPTTDNVHQFVITSTGALGLKLWHNGTDPLTIGENATSEVDAIVYTFGDSDVAPGITAVTVTDPATDPADPNYGLQTTTFTVVEANLKAQIGGLTTDTYHVLAFGDPCDASSDKTFTVNVYPKIDVDGFDLAGKTLTYNNGDHVDDIWFTPYQGVLHTLIYGGISKWERIESSDDVTGELSREEGQNILPRFRAVNNTEAPLTAVYKFYAISDDSCKFYSDARLTIVVNPYTIENTNIEIAEVQDITACVGAELANDIVLTATYKFPETTPENFDENVEYAWTLIEGVDVLGLGTEGVLSNDAGETFATLFVAEDAALEVSGTGLYKVTPRLENSEGYPTSFRVTVNEVPAITYSEVEKSVYTVGDKVSIIVDGSPYYKWTQLEEYEGTEYVETGLIAGQGTKIPTFTATTAGEVAILVTPVAGACEGDSIVLTFSVHELPVLEVEVADSIICSASSIIYELPLVDEGVYHYNLVETGGPLDVTFNELGGRVVITATTANKLLVATYTLTLVDDSTGVSSAPVTFKVTVVPQPTIADVQDIVVSNGQVVPAITFSGSAVSGYSWAVEGTVNIPSLQPNGSGRVFPSFTAVNLGTTPTTTTFVVTAAPLDLDNVDCDVVTDTFTITVYPNVTIPDELPNLVLCYTDEEVEIELTEEAPAGVTYTLEFVSGKQVGDFTFDGEKATFAAGFTSKTTLLTGTYRITATNDETHVVGETKEFTITIVPVPTIADVKDIVVANGQVVPAIAFKGTSVGSYSWAVEGAVNIPALQPNGSGPVFPSFTAVNLGTAKTETVIVVTAVPLDVNADCGVAVTDTFTISVLPTAVIPVEIADSVNCVGSTYLVELAQQVDVKYTLKLIGGQHVGIELIAPVGTSDPWTIASAALVNTTNSPITGIYRVTAIDTITGKAGASDEFAIKVLPAPAVNDPKDIEVISGTRVPAFTFTGNVIGGSYTWALSDDTEDVIPNLAEAGEGYFPAFVAENFTENPLVATYVVFAHSGACTVATDTFTITVYPAPGIEGIADVAGCEEADFSFEFAEAADTEYTVEFVSGVDVSSDIDLSVSSEVVTVEGTLTEAGVGVYKITPSNTETGAPGVPSFFKITVYPAPAVDDPQDIEVTNGTSVPAFTFTGNVEGGTYTWALSDETVDAIPNLAVKGAGRVFPSFVAENFTAAPLVATYTVTAHSGDCTVATEDFTITVNPSPVIEGLVDVADCNGEEIELTFTPDANTNYTLAFVSGTKVASPDLSLTAGVITGTLVNEGTAPIVGKYKVTPSDATTHAPGEPSYFTVTVYPAPAVNAPRNIEVVNGTVVPAFTFTGNVDGGTYSWATSDSIPNLAKVGEGNVFPSFVAENFGTAPITATYTVTALSGTCDEATEDFTITVHPAPSIAGIVNVAECNNANLSFGFAAAANTDYTLAFVSGDQVSSNITLTTVAGTVTIGGKLVNGTKAPLVATYKVTPSNSTTHAPGEPSYFIVTVYPLPNVDKPKDIEVVSGSHVSAIAFTGNVEGGSYTWELTAGLGWANIPDQGVDAFPEFVAENFTDTIQTSTYSVFAYSGGGCDRDSTGFTITIYPEPKAGAIENYEICTGGEVNIALTDKSNVNIAYKFAFASGIKLTPALVFDGLNISGNPVNTTNKVISGTYKVTPYNTETGLEGTPIFFTVTVYPAPQINTPSDIVAVNGDVIAGFNFTSTVSGITYKWHLADGSEEIPNLITNSEGSFPQFTAVNNTTDVIVATYVVEAYSGPCTPAEAEFTITVYPTPSIVDVIYDVTACHGEQFLLELTDQLDKEVVYEFAYERGDNLGLAFDGDLTISGSLSNQTKAPLTGVYKLTAKNNVTGKLGEVVIFSVTVYPELIANDAIIVADKAYYNGQSVADLVFTSEYNGAHYLWQQYAGDAIGAATAGTDVFPAFTAINETATTLVAFYSVKLAYGECVSADEATFKITVYPKTLENTTDLWVETLADQTVCYDDKFESVNLAAHHNFVTPLADVTFKYVLVSGTGSLGFGNEGFIQASSGSVIWDLNAGNPTLVGKDTYEIFPLWKNQQGKSTFITLERKAQPVVFEITPSDIIVCSGEPFNAKFEGSFVTDFEWTVVDENGDTKASNLFLSDHGTTVSGISGKVVNTTDHVLIDRIRVTPINGECQGEPVYFTIAVIPVPTIDPIDNQYWGMGELTDAVDFTGHANRYEWISSNQAVYNNPTATLIQGSTSVLPASYPSFMTQNIIESPIETTITVTPYFSYGTVECKGTPTSFKIIVAPKPIIADIDDVTICDGSKTTAITPTGLPAGSGYYISWTVEGLNIGLQNSAPDFRGKSVPAFKATLPPTADKNEPTIVTVTVVPHVAYSGAFYNGTPVTFNYVVYPLVIPAAGYEENVTESLEFCEGDNITIDVVATGYNKTYQWYKNGSIIDGATKSTYTVKSTISSTGEYYAIVSGECNSVQTKTYKILVKGNVIEQRWNDVLIVNCNPSQNGGYTFNDFQWYKTKDGQTAPLPGETKSYLSVTDANAEYFVKINGGTFVSCSATIDGTVTTSDISIYPNPVSIGELVTVKSSTKDIVSIQVVNSTGSVVGVPAITNTKQVEVRVPNTAGVYIIRVVTDISKSFTIIVK